MIGYHNGSLSNDRQGHIPFPNGVPYYANNVRRGYRYIPSNYIQQIIAATVHIFN